MGLQNEDVITNMLNAAKLKTIRQEKGLSQTRPGQAVGNDAAYIRNLESGFTPNPGYQTLAWLAVALDVSADALLDFDAATQGLQSPPPRYLNG